MFHSICSTDSAENKAQHANRIKQMGKRNGVTIGARDPMLKRVTPSAKTMLRTGPKGLEMMAVSRIWIHLKVKRMVVLSWVTANLKVKEMLALSWVTANSKVK